MLSGYWPGCYAGVQTSLAYCTVVTPNSDSNPTMLTATFLTMNTQEVRGRVGSFTGNIRTARGRAFPVPSAAAARFTSPAGEDWQAGG